MSSGEGSGRTSAGQFSNKVVDGIGSTDKRPEGKERKHWPKPGDVIEKWLTTKRDEQHKESPEWWTIHAILVEYQAYANRKQYLGAPDDNPWPFIGGR